MALKLWIKGQEVMLQPVTGPLIIAKVERLWDALDLPSNSIKFSNSWIDEFKRHYALQQHQSHGEASSVNLTSVKDE